MPQAKPLMWILIFFLLNFLMILIFNSFSKNKEHLNITKDSRSLIYENKTKW